MMYRRYCVSDVGDSPASQRVASVSVGNSLLTGMDSDRARATSTWSAFGLLKGAAEKRAPSSACAASHGRKAASESSGTLTAFAAAASRA